MIAQQAEVVACHPLFDVEGVHEVAVDIGGGEHAAAGESGAGDALQLLQFAFFELVFALLALEDVATSFFAPAKLQGWYLQGGAVAHFEGFDLAAVVVVVFFHQQNAGRFALHF